MTLKYVNKDGFVTCNAQLIPKNYFLTTEKNSVPVIVLILVTTISKIPADDMVRISGLTFAPLAPVIFDETDVVGSHQLLPRECNKT